MSHDDKQKCFYLNRLKQSPKDGKMPPHLPPISSMPGSQASGLDTIDEDHSGWDFYVYVWFSRGSFDSMWDTSITLYLVKTMFNVIHLIIIYIALCKPLKYVYVCMYVRMYICMYICIYVCM